jgi:hypothetical protein
LQRHESIRGGGRAALKITKRSTEGRVGERGHR